MALGEKIEIGLGTFEAEPPCPRQLGDAVLGPAKRRLDVIQGRDPKAVGTLGPVREPEGKAPSARSQIGHPVAGREFQGRTERTIYGEWVPTMHTFPAGTAYVSVDQPLGRLAFTLLEPRSDDGFVAWAILDEQIEQGLFPVLRVAAPGR